MKRRTFLASLSGMAIGQTLLGCSTQGSSTLRILLLKGSIPVQIRNEFQKYLGQQGTTARLQFSPETPPAALFEQLQQWKQQAAQSGEKGRQPGFPWMGDRADLAQPFDLITLGDFWLETAIRQQLIHPLDVQTLKGWQDLPSVPWHTLVTRNRQGQPDPRGLVWGVPYRWGSLVLAYRQDQFQRKGLQPPSDWSDLWRPELQHRFSLLDSPRVVIGLTLKKLGQSFNTANPSRIPSLTSELQSLNRQAKFYSSDAYLQPLILGDTWLAVGWSSDVLPLIKRNPSITAVFPRSGTALWADLWVRPVAQPAELSPLAREWISFGWMPPIASQLSLLSLATSPIVQSLPPDSLPDALRLNPVLLPNLTSFRSSDFLLPLSAGSISEYQSLWTTIRQAS